MENLNDKQSPMMWRLFVVVIAAMIALAVLAYPVLAQQPAGNIGVYWTDPAVVTGPLVLASDSVFTPSQYFDFKVTEDGDTVTSTTKSIGNGYAEPDTGLALGVMYDFELPPGEYSLLCRIRVEVEADNLAYGYDDSDLQITDRRTFYGIHVNNGVIIQPDTDGYAVCGTYAVEWLYYYFPIIFKTG